MIRSRMAHYNTTIWIVTVLTIIVLSGEVSTGNEKDPLKQKLLDRFEYGSSSAVPTDKEVDLSKLKLKDELDSGLSSVTPTNSEIYISKLQLIDEYNYLQALNRGRFTSPQIDITKIDRLDEVRDILDKILEELDYNYTYDTLVFIKLMTLENYTIKELYEKVDYACSNWAQHMLNARINSGFPFKRFPYTLWMYYLYMKKMKMFAMRDAKQEMNNLNGYMMTHLNKEMILFKCFWPKSVTYDPYETELSSLDYNSAFEKITEACTHLNMVSESKLHLNHDLDSTLYINNVVEDTVFINTLIASFGGLHGKKMLVSRLRNSINAAKNPTSSLSDWIHSLHDVHYYFLRIVKTIMLRIWWAFLKNLKTMGNSQSAEQLETILIKQHLNDFAILFKLNTNDDFMKLINLNKNNELTECLGEISPSFSWIIEEKMKKIIRLLNKYETEKDELIYGNYYEPVILEKVYCQTSTLVDIAKGISYKIEIRSPVRESILCAEVFVEYLKNKLSHVNFNILQSFDVLDQWVRKKTFVW